MDNRKQSLTDLLAKVEAGKVDHKANIPTFAVMFDKFTPETLTTNLQAYRAYNGSLDAAKALHEAVLHGDWGFRLVEDACDVFDRVAKPVYSGYYHENPARAWLIAIIKALIAKVDA